MRGRGSGQDTCNANDLTADRLNTKAIDAKFFPNRIPAPLLKDYAEVWLEQCTLRGLKPNTHRSYKQNLEDHVIPIRGELPLGRITRQDVIPS